MNQRPHKQSMSELKLRRLVEHNQRLMEDLSRPRINVSEASARCVFYTSCGSGGRKLTETSYLLTVLSVIARPRRITWYVSYVLRFAHPAGASLSCTSTRPYLVNCLCTCACGHVLACSIVMPMPRSVIQISETRFYRYINQICH